ncbi:hypothetical protein U1Q18_024871 [Sarracenia purpurea var. burkii]
MLSKTTMRKDKLHLPSLLILVCLASFVSPNQAFIGDAFDAVKGFAKKAFYCQYLDYDVVEPCLGQSLLGHLKRDINYIDEPCCKKLKEYHDKCTALFGELSFVWPSTVQKRCKNVKHKRGKDGPK